MKDSVKNLEIILDNILKLERYIDWILFEEFIINEEKYDACCMVLQQIWEIWSKLDDWDFSLEEFPISQMRWLRNRITHDYIWLDDQILWDTIQESIPQLKKIILNLLK